MESYQNKTMMKGDFFDNLFDFFEEVRKDLRSAEEIEKEQREEEIVIDRLVSKVKLLLEAKLKEARLE